MELKNMEIQKKQITQSPTLSPIQNLTVPEFPQFHSDRNTGGHISISPQANSPGNSSASSPPHNLTSLESFPSQSPKNDEHISPSPAKSPENSSFSSDLSNADCNFSPERDKFSSVENRAPPVLNRTVLEDSRATVTKTEAVDQSVRRKVRSSSVSSLRREVVVKKAGLGFRILGILFCLISFSVLVADREQGWALDSFDRYKEFRYSMAVNVIGFVYSAAQAIDLSYNLATGKYIVPHKQHLRNYVDFAIDQMIAYLLISSSSSATTRVDDWKSNWGKDNFPDMASASVAMSFLAFVAIASNALISGYILCTSKSV